MSYERGIAGFLAKHSILKPVRFAHAPVAKRKVVAEIISRSLRGLVLLSDFSDMTGSDPEPARKTWAVDVVVGSRYILNKQTLSIQQDGGRRDLWMLCADTVVVVEALSPTEPLVTVSHNGLSCLVFARDLIERGALVGIRVAPENLGKAASSSAH